MIRHPIDFSLLPRHIKMILFVLFWSSGFPVYAQEQLDYSEPSEQELQAFQQLRGERAKCFDYYRFGSVVFDIPETPDTQAVFNAGQTVTVQGTVTNMNDYPIPDGAIVAIIRRDDDTVASENWHPGIEQITLPQTYSLQANESKPFTFTWTIPASSPKGDYRIEFSYLAGGRYVLSGVPYVANFPGGRFLFTVRQGGSAKAAHFLRNTIRLNNQPLALRSVPPTLPADQPVTVTVQVTALSPDPIPVTLTTTLHNWSATDENSTVVSSKEDIVLAPNIQTPITFTWNNQKPGTYELVLTAISQDTTLLPSLIKIRFPIEGNVPRIIYSGIGGYEDNEAVIVTCVVNATRGEGQGQASTQITADGKVLASAQSVTDAGTLTAYHARVPLSRVSNTAFTVATQLKDDRGQITDGHTLQYNPVLTERGGKESTSAQRAEQPFNAGQLMRTIMRYTLLAALVVSVVAVAKYYRRRKSSNT